MATALIRPGVNVTIRDLPPARSFPTDTGVWFVCERTDRGLVTPQIVESLDEFVDKYGGRVTYSLLYDALDAFFNEGGHRAIVSRVVGPGAAKATRNLLDAGAAISLVVTAKSPGEWGNNLTVQVTAGGAAGTFRIIVRESGTIVDQSSDLLDVSAAVAWAQYSDYIDLALGASANDPAVAAAAALSGGTQDAGNITDTQWQTAIDRFTLDMGPGQISFPGRTTDTAHGQLLIHCSQYPRRALLDLPDSPSKSVLVASAAAARPGNGRWGAAFAPWAVGPGVLAGTTRTVPYSAIEAGIIGRNDLQHTANHPAAGEDGQSFWAIGLSQPGWTDLDREDLNDAGVNIAIIKFGGVRTYGYRTLADPVLDPNWRDFGGSRVAMEIQAQGNAILERFIFDEIDGRGITFGRLDAALTAMLDSLYQANSLFGASANEAYRVDVGPTVNTIQRIANDELHAVIGFRASPMAEMAQIELVKIPVTQSV